MRVCVKYAKTHKLVRKTTVETSERLFGLKKKKKKEKIRLNNKKCNQMYWNSKTLRIQRIERRIQTRRKRKEGKSRRKTYVYLSGQVP